MVNFYIFKPNINTLKKLLLALLFIPTLVISQNYIDLFTVGSSRNFNNEFDGTDKTTDIQSLDIDLTIPFVIDDNHAIVTGVIYSSNNLRLAPNNFEGNGPFYGPFAEKTTLYNTVLKVGLNKTFSDKWSGTFIVLPKLASDYQDLSGEDFYIGGAALFSYQKNERLKYKFGWYAMGQAFGLFTTPIIGFYYISADEKLEMNVSIPVSADINYKVGPKAKVGFNYYAIGRSFDIHKENAMNTYLDYVALEFTGYLQYGFMDNSILLRAKAGFAPNTAELYANDDKVDFRVSAFDFGDNRTQLNPDLSGSLFAKLEAVYRFDLSEKE